MKNSKICPKCGSSKVFRVEGMQGIYVLRLSLASSVLMERWICSGCGYSEEWLTEDDLDFVEQYRLKHQKDETNNIKNK